jgi:hypothetical protein
MIIRCTIPALPPSLNRVVTFNARHKATHPDAVDFQKLALSILHPYRFYDGAPDELWAICLFLTPDGRRRDLDNLLKVLIDAVSAALAFDDSRLKGIYAEKRMLRGVSAVHLVLSDHRLLNVEAFWADGG